MSENQVFIFDNWMLHNFKFISPESHDIEQFCPTKYYVKHPLKREYIWYFCVNSRKGQACPTLYSIWISNLKHNTNSISMLRSTYNWSKVFCKLSTFVCMWNLDAPTLSINVNFLVQLGKPLLGYYIFINRLASLAL